MKKIACFLLVALVLFTPSLAASGDTLVYVTNTGECYHRAGCSYLKSTNEVTLDYAVDHGYRPCSRCSPPRLDSSASRSVPTTAPTKAPSRSYSSGSSSSSRSYSSSLPAPSASSHPGSSESLVWLYVVIAAVILFVIFRSKERTVLAAFFCGACWFVGVLMFGVEDSDIPFLENMNLILKIPLYAYLGYLICLGPFVVGLETASRSNNPFTRKHIYFSRLNRLTYLGGLIFLSSALPGCEILFIRILYISVFVFYFFAHWIEVEKIYKEGS